MVSESLRVSQGVFIETKCTQMHGIVLLRGVNIDNCIISISISVCILIDFT